VAGYLFNPTFVPEEPMNTNKIFNLMMAFVFAISLLGMPASALAQEPQLNPHIEASTTSDFVDAFGWLTDTVVTMTIDDPTNGIGVDYTATATMGQTPWNPDDPNDTVAEFNDLQGFNVQPGDIITVSGSGLSKTLTVSQLAVTGFDLQADTISGTGTAGVQIEVCANVLPDRCINRYVTPDDSGNWTTNYHEPGTGNDDPHTFDLQADSNGWAAIRDEDGDSTWVEWQVPIPTLDIRLTINRVDAYNWPQGTQLTLVIDDDTDQNNGILYTKNAIADYYSPDDPTATLARFYLSGYSMKIGDYVTVSGGGVTKTRKVGNVTITSVDMENDIIRGTVDTTGVRSVLVRVQPIGTADRRVVPTNGIWMADFSQPGQRPGEEQPYDIRPGSHGFVRIDYEDGDVIAEYWSVPIPTFNVNLKYGLVEAFQWPVEATITISIDNPSTTQSPDFTATQVATNGGFYYDFPSDYVPGDGDLFALTDGTTTKSLVIPNIQVKSFDTVNDRVTGTTSPNRNIRIDVGAPNGTVETRSDGDGNWLADFAGKADLQPSSACDIYVYDDDEDATIVGWEGNNPYIQANPKRHFIYGRWWPVGTELTLVIDDPSTPTNDDYHTTATSVYDVYTDALPNAVFADFPWPTTFGLQPGFILTVTGGGITQILTLSPLRVTSFDFQADTISGLATPGAQVRVKVNVPSSGNIIRFVTADATTGVWTVDYSIPGVPPSEPDTYTLKPGDSGTATETDANGNLTSEFWHAPEPPANQPPVITAITAPITPVQLGQSIDATVTFSDPDVGDTHTVTRDWGDGSTTTTSAVVPSVATSHTYTSAGVYTVTGTITDAAGESASATFQYVVIYDPNGGFVTGGGWINSPAGAYTADPTLIGKATFGFISKYQKGANVPTGNTEFQFKVADLNFKSTSYDWLVIAGSKAQYKGTGTINGTGEYKFMLTAIDGTPDKFRIKIWDTTTGGIVYDNMHGLADSADPTTVLGGGSIVIHKEK
jgi:hypothetical protein